MIRTGEASARAPLWHALGLDAFVGVPVVAVVGGGGKTSLLYALGREVASLGGRAVVTGTARFTAAPHGWPAPPRFAVAPGEAASIAGRMPVAGAMVATGVAAQPPGRLAPLAVEEVDTLARTGGVDALFVEADGSRARPFKAPGEGEPALPASATHVAAVVGAGVFGQPLEGGAVHRPERVRAIVPGLPPDAHCDAALIARVLAHHDGGRRGVDGRAFAVVVNQADTYPEAARAIATAVREAGVPRVLVTALRDLRRPVLEVMA